MPNLIDKPTLLLLLASLGLMVLPHLTHLPLGVVAFFYLLWGWRLVGVWKPLFLPNRLVLLLLMVVGIALLYSFHNGIFGRDAGTQLFLVALGLKLMELKGKRDLYLVTFLAFVVAASQFLYKQNVLMGAYTIAISGLLLAVLVMISSPMQSLGSVLKTAFVLLIQAFPITIALFVLFPRFEPPRWAMFKDNHTAKSGLSDSMEPGSISELGLSDEVAFRVQFVNGIPPAHERYWRGPVLAYTDGKRWTQIIKNQLIRPISQPQFTGRAYQYKLLMEPQAKNWVYALDLPSEFPQQLRQTGDYRLLALGDPQKHAEYMLMSMPHYSTGDISRIEYEQNLQLPSIRSEKVLQLVKQLHGFEQPPQHFINQVLKHFREENFYYSLTPPLLDEEQPLESFLFKTRYGFCSHYAAAFVYMMRLANIPARVVTGYQGGEWNPMGNFLEIRQADAHAWAEVWLQQRGWVRVDPTAAVAPERIEKPIDINNVVPDGAISFSSEHSIASSWLVNARQLWGNVDYSWQRWVINYNHRNQSAFLSTWGIGNLKEMLRWLLLSVGLATALVTAFILWPKNRPNEKLLKIYQQFCSKLAKCGLVKSDSEGEGDFARRAGLQLPEYSEQIDEITQVFVALRYGKQPNVDDERKLDQLVKNLTFNH